VAIASVAFVSTACGGSSTAPSVSSSLHISPPTPATGATIHVAGGGAVGTFIAPGSGQLSIPITVTSGRQLAWAQLYVYLMTADDPDSYCAQNLPDAPGWGLAKGQTESVTITGFQVFRLPCDVTAIRAYLATRDTRRGGLETPPRPDETVALDVFATSYQLRRP